MIGTGASAIQFIPAIAPQVEKLTVFQRSAAYVLPKPDKTYPPWQKLLFSRLPGTLRLSRALIYLHHEVTAFAFVDVGRRRCGVKLRSVPPAICRTA